MGTWAADGLHGSAELAATGRILTRPNLPHLVYTDVCLGSMPNLGP